MIQIPKPFFSTILVHQSIFMSAFSLSTWTTISNCTTLFLIAADWWSCTINAMRLSDVLFYILAHSFTKLGYNLWALSYLPIPYTLFLIRKGIRNEKYVTFFISYLIRNKEWHVLFIAYSLFVIKFTQCRFAECWITQCRFAECLFAKCRFAECWFGKCRFAEYRIAECQLAQCRLVE